MGVVQTFEYRQQSAEDCLRLFHTGKSAAYLGLRHTRMKVSAGLRHAYASLSLLSRRVVKNTPNISFRFCHCALWAELRSQGQVARWPKILEEKLER